MFYLRKLFPLVLFGLLVSCSTAYHQAEFIRPSEIYVPSNIGAVGLINRAAGPLNTAALYTSSIPFDYLAGYPEWMAEAVLEAFEDEIGKLKRYEIKRIDWDNSARNDRSFMLEPLSATAIDSLCDLYQVDALVVVEGLEMNIRTTGRVNMISGVDDTGEPLRIPEFSGDQEVTLTLGFKFYNGYQLTVLDDYQNTYKQGFSALRRNPNQQQLEYPVVSLADLVAKDYASRVAPYWQSDYRRYYRSGTQALEDIANELNYSGDWQAAAASWKELAYKSEIAKEKYSASFNMGLASEMLGQPKIAKEWLIKAKAINATTQVEDYLEIIDRQILIYDVVDAQLGLE